MLLLAVILRPFSAHAAISSYTTLASWQSAASGTQTSISLSTLPGNDANVGSATISGVTFSGSLQECSGSFPSGCTGSGGTTYLIGYPSVTVTPPTSVNVSAVAADFAAYYGNSPQTLTITAYGFKGDSLSLNINPGNSISFIGFISSDPNDPITSIVFNELNSLNYAAVMDFYYYSTNYAPVAITTSSPLPSGSVGSAYNLTMAATGGLPPYTWTAAGLPPGLTISSGGIISGTPVSTSAPIINITATDALSTQATGTFSLQVFQNTSTTLSANLGSPSQFGSNLSLTATVSPNPQGGVVGIFDGATLLGSTTLSSAGNGTFSVTTPLLNAGVHNLTAKYFGISPLTLPSSGTHSQTVTTLFEDALATGTVYSQPSNTNPTFVLAGDFNNDGHPDISVANYFGASITVYLGTATGALQAGSTYTVGTSPTSIAAGDFNGDGLTDLAVANLNSGTITILKGTGGGIFTTWNTLNLGAGTQPTSVGVADFNGDGVADLAVTLAATNQAVVYTGDNAGNFSLVTTLTTGTKPQALAIGDFNGDGEADFAVSNYNSANITVFLNGGSNQFAATTRALASGGNAPIAIAAYDLDADGHPDLVTANYGSGDINVFWGDSGGAFSATPLKVSVGSNPYFVAAGDFNSDGATDLAVPLFSNSSVPVLSGAGANRSFGLMGSYSAGPGTVGNSGAAVADFDSNGVSDLAIASYGSNSVSVMLGLGATTTSLTLANSTTTYGQANIATATVSPTAAAGTVTFYSGASTLGSSTVSNGIATFDLSTQPAGSWQISAGYDGDALDSKSSSASLSLVVNKASSSTSVSTSQTPTVSGSNVTLTATVAGVNATGTVTFLDGATPIGTTQNLSANGIAAITISTLAVGSHSITAVYSGDANNTGSTSQPLTQQIQNSTVTTLTSSANPSIVGAGITFTATVSPSAATGSIQFVDGATPLGSPVPLVNGTAATSTSALSAGAHTITAVYSGDTLDAGSVSNSVSQTVLIATTTTLTAVPSPAYFGQQITLTATINASPANAVIVFFDGTTILGSAVGSNGTASIQTALIGPGPRKLAAHFLGTSLYQGSTGTATISMNGRAQSGFSSGTITTTGPGNIAAVVGDFNNDGKQDIAQLDRNPSATTGTVTVLLGNGDGTFQSPQTANLNLLPVSFAVGDFNGDGNQDLVVGASDHSFVILNGSGNGAFSVGAPQFTQATFNNIQVGDINSDGIADLIVGGAGGVNTFTGVGNGTFNAPGQPISTGGTTVLAYAVDLNTDTKTDILAIDDAGNLVTATGAGDGTFGAPQTVSLSVPLTSAAFADFNGDSVPDVVIGTSGGQIEYLTGNGNGTMTNQGPVTAGTQAKWVAAGDANGDGIPDLLVADATTGNAILLAGTGSAFGSSSVTALPHLPSGPLAVGNFSGGTGRLDAAIPASGSGVEVLAGLPPGVTISCPISAAPAVTGVPYSMTCSASGAVTPYTFALTSGSLPGGLSLSPATGQISGTPNAAGTFTFTIQATDSDVPAQSKSASVTLQVATPITTISSPLAPATVNAAYTNTLVTGGTPPYNCSVTSGSLPQGLSLAPSTCILSGSPSGPATYSFGVSVSDSGTPAQSTSANYSLTVLQVVTATTLSSSANPSVFGNSVTFTASVSPVSATGTVNFFDGATLIGSGALIGGAANVAANLSPAGQHNITAVYGGDTNDLGSASTVLTQTVNRASPTLSLSSSANPSTFGNSVTFTASLNPTNATGSITFLDNGSPVGSGNLSGGTATYSTSALSVGTHPFTASYAGDINNNPSTSPALNQAVDKIVSTIVLTSSVNPSMVGSQVTLTATVSPATSTGSVTFFDGTLSLGSAPLTGGSASIVVQSFSFGPHSLTAAYAGDTNDTASTSAVYSQSGAYPTISIVTPLIPSGTVGVSYGAVTFTASGGSGTFTWTATGLPSGLTLNSAGLLSGTPQAASNGSIVVTATDKISNLSASQTFSLTIALAPISVTGPGDLGDVLVGGAVSASFKATGGAGTYTWSISGAPGLSIDSTGKVSGAAGGAGTFTVAVAAKDIAGGYGSASASLEVFGLNAPSLPNGDTTSNYSASLSAIGGVPPYTYSASGLPPGISFSAGTFSGKPTIAGTYPLTLTATDSRNLTVSVNASITVTGALPVTVSSSSLAAGTVGQTYSQNLTASGGQPPYSWSLSGGVLPAGLSVSSSGTVSGVPTTPTAGAYSFGVRVIDNSGGQAAGSVSIAILPQPLQINASAFPNGQINAPYPGQILTASGGVAPYTFAITSGSLPAGITLTNGRISGKPTETGVSSFTITVTDSAPTPATTTLSSSITINPASADLVLAAASAQFSFAAGATSAPAAATIGVSSTDVSQVLGFSLASSVPWVDIGGATSTPGSFTITVNSAGLNLSPAGSPYSGTVTITCKTTVCAGKSQTVALTLNVQAAPPQLSVDTTLLSFASILGQPQTASSSITIANVGGGTLNITSLTPTSSWISVGARPSTLAAGAAAPVTISANPAGLSAGYYRGTVAVVTSAGSASVPVALLVSNAASMALGPAGSQFSVPAGGALGNPNGSFLVSTTSATPVSFSASVVAGAGWLTMSGNGGSASSASSATIAFSLDQNAVSALPAGAYYGTIRVSSSGVVNSPIDFQVVLNVAPAATSVVPDPEPAGLVFIGSGSSALPPQTIQVFASSTTAIGYQASAVSSDGGWLSIASGQGSASASSPGQVSVTANPAGLKPGIYRGGVSFAFPSSEIRTVNVTLIVPNEAITASPSVRPKQTTGPTCTNPQLAPTQTGLVTNFQTPASWPTPLAITLPDSCGNLITNGQIVITFSNGDPPLALTLVDSSKALYSGTWTPRRAASQVSISARATAPGYIAATAQIAGGVVPNAAPVLAANGTGDIFNPIVGGGLGPGNIVQIYGTGLAAQAASPSVLPLPTAVSGTSVLIGGVKSALYYVSPTQINAQIPFELAPNRQYQVIVNANGALTTPQPIQLNAGAPAVLAFTSGAVVAQHQDGTLISETAPAAPGEFIVIYLTGLGATTVDVPTGQPSPTNPLAFVVDTPVLNLGGTTIQPLFAGLTPGLVGLYQINFEVPKDLPDGNYDLSISQSGAVSNSTLLQVRH